MDQFECVKLQTLCKDAYYVFFPKILKTFYLERQYVHLYISNKKSIVVAYLDNYKGKEISFRQVKEIPDRLKYFSTIQYDNTVLLCGGMNASFDNPEDVLSQQFHHTHNNCFEFNVKHSQLLSSSKMTMHRAKHCLTMASDPKNNYNKLILAIGGVYITNHRDLFLKKRSQKYHDTDIVEFFNLHDKKWEVYNSKLQIARHSCSACQVGDYVYVIGGHTVQHQKKFINTMERCHKSIPSSLFERINVKQNFVDLHINNILAYPLKEDKGILIISSSTENEWDNQGFFIDLKSNEMKVSKFQYSIGPINDWKNSSNVYEQRINFLTEQLQILRFENQGCEWTLFDLPYIEKVKGEDEEDSRVIKDEYGEEIFDDGTHLYRRDQFQYDDGGKRDYKHYDEYNNNNNNNNRKIDDEDEFQF